MKMPVAWHEECLKNSKEHYQREKTAIKYAQERLSRLFDANTVLELQIIKAKEQGRDGFDADKFLRRKKKKE